MCANRIPAVNSINSIHQVYLLPHAIAVVGINESEPTYITPGTYRDLRGPLYTPRYGESRRRSYVHATTDIHRNSLHNIRVCVPPRARTSSR
jgi:hypothetical protein